MSPLEGVTSQCDVTAHDLPFVPIRAVYPERSDSSIMTLSILMRWVVTQTNRMIPSMTRYAATTRSRRCPRESEPLAGLKFESKQRVIFPLATVAMAY